MIQSAILEVFPPVNRRSLSLIRLGLWGITLLLAGAAAPRRAAADPVEDSWFEKKIRPVLVQHCYGCHAADAKSVKGGLRVDHRDGLRIGGDSGPAVVPGDPAKSLLLAALAHDGSFYDMPPERKLPDDVIADFRHWIEQGAPDPRLDPAPAGQAAPPRGPVADANFWAFQAIGKPSLPQIQSPEKVRTPIDAFVLHRLEAQHLVPTVRAERTIRLRRLYYDLAGLPPPLEDIIEFQNIDDDHLEETFDRLVDRLLARPQFGERWGRHWLDVARFSESSGGGRTLLFPNAWRYRDYVIDFTNSDRPFTEVIVEQIAGDLLPAALPADRNRQLIATAFLALGPTNYERQDKEILELDVVDEQLETIGRAFLGMTLGCARCHDHKFDPIPTRDYYALAGIFRSTKTLIHDNVSNWVDTPLVVPDEEERVLRIHEEKMSGYKAQLKAAKDALKATSANAPTTGDSQETSEAKALREQIQQLEKELKACKEQGPIRPVAMSVSEQDQIEDSPILIRGNTQTRGLLAPRGFLSVVPSREHAIGSQESGRKQLAEWIVDDRNPLPARVTANRIWCWLTGQGIVRTVDNFGSTGELPTHPELLDYLARRLSREDWSVKRLVREIVQSDTYARSSQGTAELVAADPDNRAWGRMNRRRLDAEALRDTMLWAAGNLDLTMAGPTIKTGTTIEYDYQFDDSRRSIYTPVFRNTLLELFETFDFADPNLSVSRRYQSTTATQALYLLNHPFPRMQARMAAQRLLADSAADEEARIELAYGWVLGRAPISQERSAIRDYLHAPPHGGDADLMLNRWTDVFQSLFSSLEMRYLE